MPRYRGTKEGTASLAGRLLLLIAAGKETSGTLASKLGVSGRQVNRYILQLKDAGWQIERRGVPTHNEYWFELVAPQLVLPRTEKRNAKRRT
jgi:biotin operon repressor